MRSVFRGIGRLADSVAAATLKAVLLAFVVLSMVEFSANLSAGQFIFKLPSGDRACPAFTDGTTRDQFPDEDCTGVLPGVTRTSSGSITTSSNGQIIENLNVSGRITVQHDNVTIRNVRVTNPNGVAITNIAAETDNLLIEDVELDGTGNATGASAVDFFNYTLRRANIHHYGEGPGCGNNNVIDEMYYHDPLDLESTGAHQDGVQCEGGNNNIVRHSAIILNFIGGGTFGNAAIVFGGDTSGNIAEYNLLAGGGFTLYPSRNPNYYRHNRFAVNLAPNGFGDIYGGYTITSTLPPCDNRRFDGASANTAVSNGGNLTC